MRPIVIYELAEAASMDNNIFKELIFYLSCML